MHRLREVEPEDVGITVSKRSLLVVQGGACDFYDLRCAGGRCWKIRSRKAVTHSRRLLSSYVLVFAA